MSVAMLGATIMTSLIQQAHATKVLFCYNNINFTPPCFSNMGDCMKHQKTDPDATSKCRIIKSPWSKLSLPKKSLLSIAILIPALVLS